MTDWGESIKPSTTMAEMLWELMLSVDMGAVFPDQDLEDHFRRELGLPSND